MPPLIFTRASSLVLNVAPLSTISKQQIRISSSSLPSHPSRVSELSSTKSLFLSTAKIANSKGLRAKFGRFFSVSNSQRSSPAVGSTETRVSEGLDSTAINSLQQERRGIRAGDSAASEKRGMTTLYISHGSPMLPIQYDDPARLFISQLSSQIEKPKAVVVISAHWDTTDPTVSCSKKHETIHDFYGFPPELYKLRYDAPGDPELAQRVVDLLQQGGFSKAKKADGRGLDHGAWVPLLLMYPEKDIPIVQLSVQGRRDAAHHYKLGQALAPLKKEGVLVIGSGSATHNLRAVNFNGGPIVPWAVAFDNWLKDVFVNNRYEDVINYIEKAPYARTAHPTPDHFYPAVVALGAAGKDAVGERIHSGWELGSVSMASFAFKSPAAAASA